MKKNLLASTLIAGLMASSTGFAADTATVDITAQVSSQTVLAMTRSTMGFGNITSTDINSGTYALTGTPQTDTGFQIYDTNTAGSNGVTLTITAAGNGSAISNGQATIANDNDASDTMKVNFGATSCKPSGVAAQDVSISGDGNNETGFFPATVTGPSACSEAASGAPGTFRVGIEGGQLVQSGTYSGDFTLVAVAN